MKTKVVIVSQHSLSYAQKEEMWALYKNYYHYSREYFMERMENNTHFSLYLYGNKIGGFTGLRINQLEQNGKNKFLMYFGQTIISYALRGQSLIPTTGIKLVTKYWKELLTNQAWFWYDALSYKAYLVSAKTVRDFYPSKKNEMPLHAKSIRDFVGKKYYGKNFCPVLGTVKKESNCLNDATVKIYDQDLADPDIAYYAQANPEHVNGHGLLTFVPVNLKNIQMLISRAIAKHWTICSKTYRRRTASKQVQAF